MPVPAFISCDPHKTLPLKDPLLSASFFKDGIATSPKGLLAIASPARALTSRALTGSEEEKAKEGHDILCRFNDPISCFEQGAVCHTVSRTSHRPYNSSTLPLSPSCLRDTSMISPYARSFIMTS